jgi:putative transposase
MPVAMNVQNRCSSLRPATDGRLGDRNGGRHHRSDSRFRMPMPNSFIEVLRRPVESAQFPSMTFTEVLKKAEIAIGMDRRGTWRDNVFVERL